MAVKNTYSEWNVRIKLVSDSGKIVRSQTMTVKGATRCIQAGDMALAMAEDQMPPRAGEHWEILYVSPIKHRGEF